ncbi:FliM/FliN family flagellar motor C-terminal domain-containing protein [Ruegeria sp. 1NDH52C]|uniref:FliM/FliN family flagellar motor C-terminal domain-containing protein n=1 Tax=Ruegeria alba TaxID=2916756 RepID=A0ABS9NVT8_9RHOB|nr:FliM/FliN family flagellar motor C-terminal domain-containing protein [Ruegeria alba]MCG6558328.1 FliM/FliN family flagellar motor C-terminal domain-containing protein [Ruegeria alba]
MATDAENKTVLERKLALARDEGQGDTRSILRALRLALARAADEAVGLAMSVIGATQARRELDELGRAVAEDRLYLMLSGPDGALGAACIDRACVTAILQQQTMGQVVAGGIVERAFTGTDAAMVAPLIDALLPRAREMVDQPADRTCLTGYEFCARAESRRALLLLLEYDRYRAFDLTAEIGGGKAQGQITLILPDRPDAELSGAEGGGTPRGRRLDEAFGVVRAELDAVIARIRLPLAAFAGMQPGDLLPLVGLKLDRTEIVTIERRQVALARLGQSRGMRAVRLNEKLPDPKRIEQAPDDFLAHRPANAQPPQAQVDTDILEHADPPPPRRRSRRTAEDFEEIDPESEGVDDLDALSEFDLPALSTDKVASEIAKLAGLQREEEVAEPR